MIIRNRLNELIMITQHDHALVSGLLSENVQTSLFKGSAKRKSVEIAIREHDRAWMPVDKYPIMNDKTQLPFSFMDFPVSYKALIYKYGIDEVEEKDAYAALLCSTHYAHFMSKSKEGDAKTFLEGENIRRCRLKTAVSCYDEEHFQFHFNLLKFCDNLSLYISLNEPGIPKEKSHPFYKNGIQSPFVEGERIKVNWKDQTTITLAPFPFQHPLNISLKQKVVPKEEVVNKGIAHAYLDSPFEKIDIRLTKE